MTRMFSRIKIWSKSRARLFTFPPSIASSFAERYCLDSIQFCSCLSAVFASSFFATSFRVGMVKSSHTSPSREIGGVCKWQRG